jgi:hypothetical protein
MNNNNIESSINNKLLPAIINNEKWKWLPDSHECASYNTTTYYDRYYDKFIGSCECCAFLYSFY